jgi:Deoxycytidylate deaminase
MTPSPAKPDAKTFYPEIVIGFVAPSGIGFDRVTEVVRRELEHHDYVSETARLSSYLEELAPLSKKKARLPEARIPNLQTTGDYLRSAAGTDILGFVAAGLIRKAREQHNQSHAPDPKDQQPREQAESGDLGRPADRQVPGMAFLVWSLKHPAEVAALRGIYGSRFFLISVFAPREQRVSWLSEDMARRSRSAKGADRFDLPAREIIDRDTNEEDNRSSGQNVRGTFPLADFFVDARDDPSLEATVHRSIEIIFGHPFETPTRDEFGMYVAHAAKLRSAELGRQVGAAISNPSGDVVATGTNEVPAFAGGHYWSSPLELRRDNREFRRGKDQSDEDKRLLAAEVFDSFKQKGWIEADVEATEIEIYDALDNTSLQDITEYGRAVHAEMSAITDAARRGVSTAGATIYVSTFPCHTCARHVVAAGIARLVYIEPYAKSRATKLHSDVLSTPDAGSLDSDHVPFEPFVGVAPRQYINAFTMATRKEDGVAVRADEKRLPRLVGESSYGELDVAAHIQRERSAVAGSLEPLHKVEEELSKQQEKNRGIE